MLRPCHPRAQPQACGVAAWVLDACDPVGSGRRVRQDHAVTGPGQLGWGTRVQLGSGGRAGTLCVCPLACLVLRGTGAGRGSCSKISPTDPDAQEPPRGLQALGLCPLPAGNHAPACHPVCAELLSLCSLPCESPSAHRVDQGAFLQPQRCAQKIA